MTESEIAAWLRLDLTPGVGRSTARRLLAAFGSAESIFQQPQALLREVVTAAQAAQLVREPDDFAQQLARTILWLAPEQTATSSVAHVLIPLDDLRYPQSLLQTEDPPLMLYAQGLQELLWGAPQNCFPYPAALAIVGSRAPSPQGATNARDLAHSLAEAGLCIVSGLAQGIDAAAHAGALQAAVFHPVSKPLTIAVVGTGLDQVYPRQHAALARQIAQNGLLVSEYPLGSPPIAQHFPQRNRIISGLSQGTLVVEAALKSGSLITARLASEQGREVFAIPGSIHATQSHGCHALLRQGAKLVESAQDVLEELQGLDLTPGNVAGPQSKQAASRTKPGKLSPNAAAPTELPTNPVLTALGFDPQTLDALVGLTGIPASDLQAQLLELELDGHVARMPGGRFQRLGRT